MGNPGVRERSRRETGRRPAPSPSRVSYWLLPSPPPAPSLGSGALPSRLVRPRQVPGQPLVPSAVTRAQEVRPVRAQAGPGKCRRPEPALGRWRWRWRRAPAFWAAARASPGPPLAGGAGPGCSGLGACGQVSPGPETRRPGGAPRGDERWFGGPVLSLGVRACSPGISLLAAKGKTHLFIATPGLRREGRRGEGREAFAFRATLLISPRVLLGAPGAEYCYPGDRILS